MVPCSCISPIRVYNESLGCYLSMPCGHCDACLAQKGFRRKTQLADVIATFRFKYFVTLTYDDEHLPLAFLIDGVLRHTIDYDKDGCMRQVSLVELPDSNLDFILANQKKFGGVPVLSHIDLINFKKRFRYYANKYTHDRGGQSVQLFIYAVGEYGPTTFRPHYHLLFGFNDERLSSVFESCVNQSWRSNRLSSSGIVSKQLGFIDCQRVVNGSCNSYVAQYVNCTTHLPYILSRTCFRPFVQKSSDTSIRYSQQHCPSLVEAFCQIPIETHYVSVGTNKLVTAALPCFIESRYFPKLPRFCRFDVSGLVGMYSLFRRFPFEKASQFVNVCLEAFRTGFLDITMNAVKSVYYDEKDLQCTRNNLAKLFYCSRRVCRNSAALGVTVFEYVNRLLDYYSKVALNRLKTFYEYVNDLMNDFYHPVTLSMVFSLYYHTDERDCNILYYLDQFNVNSVLPKLNQQSVYESLMHRIINDTTKTKKRNDEFAKRGWRRKPFIPVYNHKFNRFL